MMTIVDTSYFARRSWSVISKDKEPSREEFFEKLAIDFASCSRRIGKSSYVFAMDPAGASWRKEVSGTYKSNRTKMPQSFYDVTNTFVDRMSRVGCIVVRGELLEADDIVAAICNKRTDEAKLILASDKDLLQLLSNDTSMWDAKIANSVVLAKGYNNYRLSVPLATIVGVRYIDPAVEGAVKIFLGDRGDCVDSPLAGMKIGDVKVRDMLGFATDFSLDSLVALFMSWFNCRDEQVIYNVRLSASLVRFCDSPKEVREYAESVVPTQHIRYVQHFEAKQLMALR